MLNILKTSWMINFYAFFNFYILFNDRFFFNILLWTFHTRRKTGRLEGKWNAVVNFSLFSFFAFSVFYNFPIPFYCSFSLFHLVFINSFFRFISFFSLSAYIIFPSFFLLFHSFILHSYMFSFALFSLFAFLYL